MTAATHSIRRSRRAQRGATLIITLVMLVLITLVCVATIRTTTLDERMAGNARDRERAFQAAEAAVRSCLALIDAGSVPATSVLKPVASGATPNWEAAWSDTNSSEVSVADTGLASKPRCMFEELGTGTGSYRITGRALGASAQTEVVLQATYTDE